MSVQKRNKAFLPVFFNFSSLDVKLVQICIHYLLIMFRMKSRKRKRRKRKRKRKKKKRKRKRRLKPLWKFYKILLAS